MKRVYIIYISFVKLLVNILSVVIFCRLSACVQAQGITVVIVIVASLVMAISVLDLLLRYGIYNFCITLRLGLSSSYVFN